MSKLSITINAKTLFPISKLKEHLREALAVTDTLGPAIITKGSRPAYAIIRIGGDRLPADNTITDEIEIDCTDQLDLINTAAKGMLITEPDRCDYINL